MVEFYHAGHKDTRWQKSQKSMYISIKLKYNPYSLHFCKIHSLMPDLDHQNIKAPFLFRERMLDGATVII